MEIGNNPIANVSLLQTEGGGISDQNQQTEQTQQPAPVRESGDAVEVADSTNEIARAVEEIASIQSQPQPVVETEDVIVALAEAASSLEADLSVENADEVVQVSEGANFVEASDNDEADVEPVPTPTADTATAALGNTVDETV